MGFAQAAHAQMAFGKRRWVQAIAMPKYNLIAGAIMSSFYKTCAILSLHTQQFITTELS
jgi:hypothetical protein